MFPLKSKNLNTLSTLFICIKNKRRSTQSSSMYLLSNCLLTSSPNLCHVLNTLTVCLHLDYVAHSKGSAGRRMSPRGFVHDECIRGAHAVRCMGFIHVSLMQRHAQATLACRDMQKTLTLSCLVEPSIA